MELIQFPTALGFLSAFSIERTIIGSKFDFLLIARSCKSSSVGSVWLAAGSSRTRRPRSSGSPSGRGIFINASICPTAGI